MGNSESQSAEEKKPSTPKPSEPAVEPEFTDLAAETEVKPIGSLLPEQLPPPPPAAAENEEEVKAVADTATPEPPKMAAMAGLEDQLREMLQCKICFDDKEKQKLLPCQHTICLDCLNRLEVHDSKYKCPLCNREMLVPNGGFDALQESLITKQLAHLIQKKPAAAGAAAAATAGAAAAATAEPAAPKPAPRRVTSAADIPAKSGGSPVAQNTELQRKLEDNIKKGKEALGKTRNKSESYQVMLDELDTNSERMKTSINNLMEQTIDKLMTNAGKKVAAIDELTTKKREELLKLIIKLTDTHEKTNRGIEILERRLSAPDQQKAVVNADLQSTQNALSDLEDLLSSLDTAVSTFRTGDSVRLKMEEAMMDSEFLLGELNHFSIGFIHQVDDDGDCAVIFPENSRWTGNVTQLEKSATKHNLPIIGDRVRVKPGVKMPHFKWGMVKSTSIGYLTGLKNTGPSKGRQIEVDFPEDHDWSALYDEIERVPPETLKVGEKVWMARGVSEPVRGWAGVTPTSVGTLLQVTGENVKVNFPECSEWQGLLIEIEKTRPIICGDKVRVKRSVTEPKFAWGGVDHDDVGSVSKILNSDEHGKVVKVNFPNRLGLWQCLLSEIEIVTRHSGEDANTTRGRRTSDIQCPTS